jgi:hypothetical protein
MISTHEMNRNELSNHITLDLVRVFGAKFLWRRLILVCASADAETFRRCWFGLLFARLLLLLLLLLFLLACLFLLLLNMMTILMAIITPPVPSTSAFALKVDEISGMLPFLSHPLPTPPPCFRHHQQRQWCTHHSQDRVTRHRAIKARATQQPGNNEIKVDG